MPDQANQPRAVILPAGIWTKTVLFVSVLHIVGCSQPISGLKDSTDKNIQTLKITGPFEEFVYNRFEDLFDVEKRAFEAAYKDVKLEFQGKKYKAKLKLRGGIRFCDAFPHFTLKMKGDDELLGGKKFKIVTHGSYDRDPTVPVNAPNCGDELADKPIGSDYRSEQFLYSIQKDIADYHLRTHPLMITYKDEVSLAETTGFGFFIEDFDLTAARYDAEETEFGTINEHISWTETDDDEIRNTIVGEEYFSFLVAKYKEIEAANPAYDRTQISSLLPKSADIANSPSIMNQLNAAADARLPIVKASLKDDQINLLLSMDKIAVMQAALFNILIGNTDWALFGLSDHPAGHRNFKFLEKGGKMFPVAYDFDLADTASGMVVSVSTYNESLADLKSNIEKTYGSATMIPLQQVIDDYRGKVQSMLAGSGPLNGHLKSSFENFLDAAK